METTDKNLGKERGMKPTTQPPAKKAQDVEYIMNLFKNNYVVIVLENGMIYEGILIDKFRNYWWVLKDAVIRGRKYEVKVDYVLIADRGIRHIHTRPKEVREIQPSTQGDSGGRRGPQ